MKSMRNGARLYKMYERVKSMELERKLTNEELEAEIFYLGGTEALMKAGKIVEGINTMYPILLIINDKEKMKARQRSMYKALNELYKQYLDKK